jgi:hypothetical protein
MRNARLIVSLNSLSKIKKALHEEGCLKTHGSGAKSINPGPQLATMRQIAWELDKVLAQILVSAPT